MAHTCMDQLPAEPAIGVAGTAKALNAHLAPKFCPLTRPCPLLTPSHIPAGKEINLFYLKHHKSCDSTWNSSYWMKTTNQDKQKQFGLMEVMAGASPTTAVSPCEWHNWDYWHLTIGCLPAQHIAGVNQSINRSIKELLPNAFQSPSFAWESQNSPKHKKKNQLPHENWSQFC